MVAYLINLAQNLGEDYVCQKSNEKEETKSMLCSTKGNFERKKNWEKQTNVLMI